MLVVAGGPGAAFAADPCDPCPPDCPMMAELAAKAAADHGKSTPANHQPESPCKQGIACQASFSMPSMMETSTPALYGAKPAAYAWLLADELASRPPDRSLRPPIYPLIFR